MNNGYFQIAWIIDLVKEQEPDRVDLIEQLEKSNIRKWMRQPYVRLISDPEVAPFNHRIEESIPLVHETEGTIVLDILGDGRIVGIEFISQISQ